MKNEKRDYFWYGFEDQLVEQVSEWSRKSIDHVANAYIETITFSIDCSLHAEELSRAAREVRERAERACFEAKRIKQLSEIIRETYLERHLPGNGKGK